MRCQNTEKPDILMETLRVVKVCRKAGKYFRGNTNPGARRPVDVCLARTEAERRPRAICEPGHKLLRRQSQKISRMKNSKEQQRQKKSSGLKIRRINRGGRNRTLLWSFGDSYSTDELHPFTTVIRTASGCTRAANVRFRPRSSFRAAPRKHLVFISSGP